MQEERLRLLSGALARAEAWFATARGARLALAVVFLASCLALVQDARGKPFWYDEVVTADVGRLPTLSHVWAALFAGADSQPFGYYVVQRAVTALPMDPHLSFRLLSMAGYAAAVVAAFAIGQRYISPAMGLLAALLLMCTTIRHGALEARSYVPLVGCVAVAAWAWMGLTDRWWRPWILAIALVGTGAFHHFGVVAVGCIALAELAVVAVERRWRWHAWLPIAAGLAQLAVSVPVLLHFRSVFGDHFWSPAGLSQIPATFTAFGSLRGAPLLFLALCVWLTVRVLDRSDPARPIPAEDGPVAPMSLPQLVLVTALILYPVWIVVPTAFAHAGYVGRYALSCVLGMSLGAALVLSRAVSPRALTALVAGLVLIVAWNEVPRAVDLLREKPRMTTAADRAHASLTLATEPLPVVVASGLDYLPIVYYERQEAASRFVQLVDREAAVSLLGTASVDETAAILKDFIPLNVVDAETFAREHPRFYIYATLTEFGWAHRYFAQSPAKHLTLLSDDGWARIYLVEPQASRDQH